MKKKDFRNVVTRYKAVFFDAYGVLKNHKGVIPGIEDTFDFLIQNSIEYYILTNDASRSPDQLAEVYHRHGIRTITSDRIISSGMLAREYLLV